MPSDHGPPLEGPSLLVLPSYQVCALKLQPVEEIHAVAQTTLSALSRQIITTESPIHTSEVARRISNAYGKSEVDAPTLDAIQSALALLRSDPRILKEGAFWTLTRHFKSAPMRRRDTGDPALQRAETISPREICAVAAAIRKQAGIRPPSDLVAEVVHALGFKRLSPDLQTTVHRALYGPS